MGWVFSAFLLASVIHMGEEYFYPGGFIDLMKRVNPRLAPAITVRMAVVVNGLQLVLCVAAMLVGRSAPVFGMSVAGLLLLNGMVHILACIRVRGYAPGVLSSLFLYIPLAVYCYRIFLRSGELSVQQVLLTLVLGLLYQAVPIGYLWLATGIRAWAKASHT